MCLSKPITRPKRTKKRTDTAAPETGQVAKTASEATIVAQTVPGATATEESNMNRKTIMAMPVKYFWAMVVACAAGIVAGSFFANKTTTN